jgi:hypothetical protein
MALLALVVVSTVLIVKPELIGGSPALNTVFVIGHA